MAEERINSGTGLYLLELDLTGGTEYDTLICSTTLGISDSVDAVDTSSACGQASAPGNVTTEVTWSGYHVKNPDTGRISGSSLRPIVRAKTIVGFRIGPLVVNPGDEIQEGKGFISNLSSTYAFDTDATFDVTISPTEDVSTVIEGS